MIDHLRTDADSWRHAYLFPALDHLRRSNMFDHVEEVEVPGFDGFVHRLHRAGNTEMHLVIHIYRNPHVPTAWYISDGPDLTKYGMGLLPDTPEALAKKILRCIDDEPQRSSPR